MALPKLYADQLKYLIQEYGIDPDRILSNLAKTPEERFRHHDKARDLVEWLQTVRKIQTDATPRAI